MNHDQIDHLINIYLDSITSISNDCGWRGEGIMAKAIDFGRAPPRSTGNVISNMSMVNAIQGLKSEHPEFPRICAIVQLLLHDSERSHQIIALLAHHYYRGLVRPKFGDDEAPDRAYDDGSRAKQIGQELSEYRFNVKAGRRWVKKLWEEWV